MPSIPRPYTFIDTCSLLESCWSREKGDIYVYSQSKDERFWGQVIPSLTQWSDVILAKRNYDELAKHALNVSKPDLADRSKLALERIARLDRSGLIQIVGDANDPFADAILLSVALKFKMQRNLVFITQDHALAEDLEAVRHFCSLKDHKKYDKYDIKVRKISTTGDLVSWKGLDKALAKRYERVSDQEQRDGRAIELKSKEAKPETRGRTQRNRDGVQKGAVHRAQTHWWES